MRALLFPLSLAIIASTLLSSSASAALSGIEQRMGNYDRSCSKASALAKRLAGHIVVEPEAQGALWYIDPVRCDRYRIYRPEDVANLVAASGIGVSNANLSRFALGFDMKADDPLPFAHLRAGNADADGDGVPDMLEQALGTNPQSRDTDGDTYEDMLELRNAYDPLRANALRLPVDHAFTKKMAGRFVLQTETRGHAWYVSPRDNRRYFLGGNATAQQVIASIALGVKSKDLTTIPESRSVYGLPTKSNGAIPFAITVPEGFKIRQFASGLLAPRVMAFAPDGTMLVTDLVDRTVIALPDDNRDGVADRRVLVLSNLLFPNGLAFVDGSLYVAQEDGLYKYAYDPKTYRASSGIRIMDFPTGGEHRTRSIFVAPDSSIYVSIGSSCNVCRETDERYAAIWRIRPDGSEKTLIARGLRNTVFAAFDPEGRLWGNDMGRDEMGHDLPPDEVNIIRESATYGWPNCYGENVPDPEMATATDCEGQEMPAHLYAAHAAPLGLVFVNSHLFPPEWQGDILSALHGSWNQENPNGFTIVRLHRNGTTITKEEVVFSGWKRIIEGQNPARTAFGRPTGLAFGSDGSLFISDDKSGMIYRVTR
jgi:glucose/arabinose dehydrogenase